MQPRTIWWTAAVLAGSLSTFATALLPSVATATTYSDGGCVGDCSGDGTVTIDELIKGVNIALGTAATATCSRFDLNGDGSVTIDEIIKGVNAAVDGCTAAPTATVTCNGVLGAGNAAGCVAPTVTPIATPVATATPTSTATPAQLIALFSADPSSPNNPFPSDRLRDATGHVAVPVAYFNYWLPAAAKFNAARALNASVASQIKALDGFGTFTPIRIRFNRPMVVNAGEYPTGIWLLEYNDLAARPAPISATAYDPESSIEVQPILPLKPKTTYALVVTTDLTDGDGNHVNPSPDFANLLAGTNLDPGLAAWRTTVQPVISFVKDAFNIDTDSLALVEVFTTESTTDDLEAIQRRLHTGTDLVPGPPCFQNCALKNLHTGIFPENTQEYRDLIGDYTSPNVAAVAIGVFDSYDFRTGPKGSFDPRYVYGPDIPPVNHLDFYMTIPKAPKPANGYPLGVFGHGLGGSGRDVGEIASLNTTAPVIGIAVTAVQHGLRGNFVNFFVLNDVSTTRENFRQTVADFMELTKMAEYAHAAGIPPFDQMDPQSLLYIGGSLGGIIGTMYMAVEPDVRVGVLSVPGGGLLNILDSISIGGLLQPLIGLMVNLSGNDPFYPEYLHNFRQVAQWSIERGDPINYGPYVVTPGAQLAGVPPKRILMHEGIVDTTVPNRTTDDLAMAMHLPDLSLLQGCQNPDGCSGIWRYVMTDYGQNETDGHYVTLKIQEATQQAFDYLTSYGTIVNDVHP